LLGYSNLNKPVVVKQRLCEHVPAAVEELPEKKHSTAEELFEMAFSMLSARRLVGWKLPVVK
jgi:hypothetical protein